MSTLPTCMIILDAARADYFTPERAPFLASLKEESMTGAFESPPGFAQRTTMFTGTYPDTSGNFSAFGYNPDNSPFRWVEKLGPLRSLYRPYKLMFPARVGVKHMTRWLTKAYHTDPAWIPARYLPFFEVVEDTRPIFDEGALPFTSIFDLLRANGKTFKYLAHPVSGDDEDIYKRMLDAYDSGEIPDLVVAQLSILDEGGHHHGPALPPDWTCADDQTGEDIDFMERAIRNVDDKVRDVHDAMTRAVGPHNLLVLGDHGMAPVRRRVNLLEMLEATGLEPATDFVVFLDSTFAKFWFHNERAEREIRGMLANADFGRILEPEERKRLRIEFDHRRYGDLMFTAAPGVLFWPDYFHVIDSTIKGMHGYVDKDEETYGALILHAPGSAETKDVGVRSLVDVFATLCNLTGVEVTEHNEGESLVSPAATSFSSIQGIE